MDAGLFINQVFNGLSLASIYFTMAIGLSLSFGYMRVINMAHGEFLMLGGYIAYIIQQSNIFPKEALPIFSLFFSFAILFILGSLLWILIIERIKDRPLDTLLLTWGLSLILQQVVRDIFGPTGVGVVPPQWLSKTLQINQLYIPAVRLYIIAVMIVVLLALYLLFFKTDIGLYLRAVNQDREMASAIGINDRMLSFFIFSLGSGIAGVGGASMAMISSITPTTGLNYIVDAFLVVIFGGAGSLLGTFLSSNIIGFISAMFSGFIEISLAKALTLLFVILFMQLKPSGLVSIKVRGEMK